MHNWKFFKCGRIAQVKLDAVLLCIAPDPVKLISAALLERHVVAKLDDLNAESDGFVDKLKRRHDPLRFVVGPRPACKAVCE